MLHEGAEIEKHNAAILRHFPNDRAEHAADVKREFLDNG